MPDTPKILITTPDYLPKLGGLTTYTLNLEKVLQQLHLPYDLYHWTSISELRNYRLTKHYTTILHIHFLAGFYLKVNTPYTRIINFLHGSELFFTSANLIKRLVKKLLRPQAINYLASSDFNIFISHYTQELAYRQGLSANYARDIVWHNTIDTTHSSLLTKTIDHTIRLCSIVRNVPHKNIPGTIKLASLLHKLTGKQIELTIPQSQIVARDIKIHHYQNLSDQQREEIYKQSHFNLLLSLDHSHQGFIEGFGLSCLEAAKYGTPSIVLQTGGLPENIHHCINGFVLEEINQDQLAAILPYLTTDSYQQLQKDTYQHLHQSHSLNELQKLMERIIL